MKVKFNYTIMILLLLNFLVIAQQEKSSIGITFSGFVKTDIIYDSRQTINLREGHFLLYPANELFDANKVDINDKPNFNILSIQTRLTGKINGPNAFGAKNSVIIEGEFFGTSDGDVNGFRLRHAYTKLEWENSSLLVGQTWHPMFVAEVFPGVVSFNTGAPFQPFSRNPQVRFTQSFGALKLIAVAASQRDFQSFGPDASNKPVQSSSFLRNSVVPSLHFQFQFKTGENIFGAGLDYKKITPRLTTTKNIKTDESVSNLASIAYLKLDLSPFTLKAEGIYGDNLADMMMLGGYAPKSVDASTGRESYTAIGSYSFWSELIYGKEVELAVFAGYSKNLGAHEDIVGPYFSRGANINSLMRISPRIQWNSGNARIASELEFTSAKYGIANDKNKGIVEQNKTISNLRMLIAVYYFF